MHELLGTTAAQAVVDLPCHLKALIAALPPGHGYTADWLIDAHTMLPFYAPFSSAKRINRLRRSIQGDGKAIHMSAGLMAGRVRPPGWLRSCPECDRRDTERHGEPYWHRLHQLAGVEVCPEHNVFLENSAARRLNPRTRHAFNAARLTRRVTAARRVDQADHTHQLLLALARDVAWLLTHPREQPPGQKTLRTRYVALLGERGLASATGRVCWKQLREDFSAHFTPEFLRRVQCGLPDEGEHVWLARLVRSPRGVQSPLRHLLLIQFLGLTAEAFFRNMGQPGAFGAGPWPCLNRVCPCHQRLVVKTCSIEHSSERGRPMGVFHCQVCAQTYCRPGPDRESANRFKIEWVRDYGPLWTARLVKWWVQPGVSLREIARRLGADPMTVKRRAAEAGLLFPRLTKRPTLGCVKPLRAKEHLPAASEVVKQRRHRWLEMLAVAPQLGIKALRAGLPALYMQLYRYDREWLRVNQPPRKPATPSVKPRVDWLARDAQLAQLVPTAATRLRDHVHDGLRKINLSSLGKEMGHLSLLEKHLRKLPLTARAVAEATETRGQFALRRIAWATEEFRRERVYPARWRLGSV